MGQPKHPMLPGDWHARSPVEKKRYLQDAADKVRENHNVQRPLDDSEKERLRFNLQEESIDLSDKQEEYKEVQKMWREDINEAKEKVAAILSKLKQGFEAVTGTTYELFDYEGERVYVFMEDGTEVDNRQMIGDERQRTVHSEMRKVETGE